MRCTYVLCGGAAFALAAAAFASDRPAIGKWGVDLSGMDRSVDPGGDFVAYANGAWRMRTTIPEDRVSFGPFANMRTDADANTRSLVEALPEPRRRPSDQAGKVAALWRSFMSEAPVSSRGDRPLRDLLRPIAGAHDRVALARLMGQANASLGASMIELEFGANYSTGRGYLLGIRQGGLRLPRAYYLEAGHAPAVEAYRAYSARLLTFVGWPDPDKAAAAIVAFETEIAKASWSRTEMRDPVRTLNPTDGAHLASVAPDFPWAAFMSGAQVDRAVRLNLETPDSVARIARIFKATPVSVLRAWLAFRTADNAAPYLAASFQEERARFQQVLGGPAKLPARWKRGVALINDAMGSAVGELYVAAHFTLERQAAIERLVENLRLAFAARIHAATWMSPSTRSEALRKLAVLEVQVGRPRYFTSYDGLVIDSGDLLGNVARAHAFDWRRRVAAAHGDWNKSDWRFWPQYPTAYTENRQLIFTAAMLQPPFFDPRADAAVNYGAIGAVIGHEISHQFDDQGRMGDADGRQRDWWSPADVARFKEQAARLSAQFSRMEPLPGLHVNGDLTLGENIADLAGLSVSLEAYHASLDGRPAPVIDGFTGDQRFFLSWAQSWREKTRPERLRNDLLADVHSPADARIVGPIRNMDGWYAAWSIRPGAKLYVDPAQRVRLW
jgi:putative endopeptidase